MNKGLIRFCMAGLSLILAASSQAQTKLSGHEFVAHYTAQPVVIDGQADEAIWQAGQWYPMFESMLQRPVQAQDFSGRFKLAWREQGLLLLVEIVDDVLFDQHADPLYLYWDDDCLEIFIDEDRSGGDHLFNYNAFAYHIGLDNQVADIGEQTPTNKQPFILLNDHIQSVWKRSPSKPNKIIWEVAIAIYDDKFKPNNQSKPVSLRAGKELGFMLAYCDNDGSEFRENFIGSTQIEAVNGDKNLGYKTADVFASLRLLK